MSRAAYIPDLLGAGIPDAGSSGVEIIENGDFSNGLTGWSADPSYYLSSFDALEQYRDVSASSGAALVISGTNYAIAAVQSIQDAAGRYARLDALVTGDAVSGGSSWLQIIGVDDEGKAKKVELGGSSSPGVFSYQSSGWQRVTWEGVIPNLTNLRLHIYGASASGNTNVVGMICDYVSLKLL